MSMAKERIQWCTANDPIITNILVPGALKMPVVIEKPGDIMNQIDYLTINKRLGKKSSTLQSILECQLQEQPSPGHVLHQSKSMETKETPEVPKLRGDIQKQL